jgi:Ser/Thr protein kinase RdoA (MazF antagonist)
MTRAPGVALPSITAAAFAALAESEQVCALKRLACNALGAWDLVAPRLDQIKYRENAVFAVTCGDGRRAIARVHRPNYRSDLDVRCEFAWMRALDEAGIATPAAIETRDGELVVTAADAGVPEARQCDLLEWVDGTPPGTLEGGVAASDNDVRELYGFVGAVAARMHELAEQWQRPVPFSRPSWNVETLVGENPTWGRFEDLDALTPEQRRVLVAARDLARERLSGLGPADALIHGDLVPDNILVAGDARRIIDFDDFGWSWIGFEMATSLFPLQISGGFDAGLAGYLEGYRSVRPFPDHELDALPDMLMARSLSYLGWPVGRPEIASARDLVPMFCAMLTETASDYLAARR